MIWHLAMRALVLAAVGLLLSLEGISPRDPALWFAFLGMAVAMMLGYDKGRNDAAAQQDKAPLDNSKKH